MKPCFALLLALSSLSLTTLGCVSTTTTHLERGELFTTGSADYDAFFKAAHSLHEDAQRARFEAEGARAQLVRALGVDNKTDAEVTVQVAKNRAESLRDKKVLLHLQITPVTKLVASLEGAARDAALDELLKAIEEAAKSSLEVSSRLAGLSDRASTLERDRAELHERAMKAPESLPEAKRDEVLAELAGAKSILSEDGKNLALYAGAASKFVVDLARAVETGATKAAEPPPEPTKPERGKPRPAPRWSGQAPGRGPTPGAPPATSPAKPAPKKSGGGDDFDP